MERALLGSLSPGAVFTTRPPTGGPGGRGSCKSLTHSLDLELKFKGDIRKPPAFLSGPKPSCFSFLSIFRTQGGAWLLLHPGEWTGPRNQQARPRGWEASDPKTGWGGPEGGRQKRGLTPGGSRGIHVTARCSGGHRRHVAPGLSGRTLGCAPASELTWRNHLLPSPCGHTWPLQESLSPGLFLGAGNRAPRMSAYKVGAVGLFSPHTLRGVCVHTCVCVRKCACTCKVSK